ncbi:MAG: cysteine desulfurase [Eubacterium sp.]|nr:cysteine desulfurase [Eubacterium sp.]
MEIYLDNAATTACYTEAADIVRETMLFANGNPSSMHHKGVEAENYIRKATETLADLLKVKEKEIFYTSGGTEADNWALRGIAAAYQRKGRHIITTAIEHPAVSAPLEALKEQGFEVTVLVPDREGLVTAEQVCDAMREDTILVSVMMVNNEIGAVEPVAEIGEQIHRKKPDIVFHVDAVQAFGKYRIRPKKMQIDLLSVSGHKIHGPKGVGFLYVDEKLNIRPLILGGGQQKGMRSGTDNVPGIAGLGIAAEKMYARLEDNTASMRSCRDMLAEGLAEMENVVLHGPSDPERTAPYILNASFVGVRSEVLLHTLEDKGIYVSAGSACSTHKKSGSPTLSAIGCPEKEKESAIRFSFSEMTTPEEIRYTLQVLRDVLPVLRRFTRK